MTDRIENRRRSTGEAGRAATSTCSRWPTPTNALSRGNNLETSAAGAALRSVLLPSSANGMSWGGNRDLPAAGFGVEWFAHAVGLTA